MHMYTSTNEAQKPVKKPELKLLEAQEYIIKIPPNIIIYFMLFINDYWFLFYLKTQKQGCFCVLKALRETEQTLNLGSNYRKSPAICTSKNNFYYIPYIWYKNTKNSKQNLLLRITQIKVNIPK